MASRTSIATRRSDNEIIRIADAVTPSLDQDVGYNALSRLVRVDRYGVANHLSYDANGNHDRYQAGNTLTRYTIDPHSNRALDYSNQDGSRQYQYDALGNRISETSGARTTTYTYNPFNRMAQSNVDGRVTDYLLNAQGQRVVKSNDAGTSRYYFAGQNQLLSELTNSTWTNYLWFGGELVGLVRNGNLINIHTDHLGRPALATDGDQRTVWKVYNCAYGRSVTQDDIGGLKIGFPGQYYDAETGLWYNGFRDYDASIARYVQSDPIGLAGGINTYAYVNGNPISLVDPLGLDALVCTYPGSGPNVWGHIGIGVGQNPTSTTGYYPERATLRALRGPPGAVRQDSGEAKECKTIETAEEQVRLCSPSSMRARRIRGRTLLLEINASTTSGAFFRALGYTRQTQLSLSNFWMDSKEMGHD